MIVVTILRSVLATIIFVFSTFFLAALCVIFNASKKYVDWLISFWGQLALWLFNVEVVEIGKKNRPLGACLYLFNHSSFFDVFVMVAKVKEMRFGAKSELFKIPIFGEAMRRAGVLPIARQNREKVFQVYEVAIQNAINHGQQYALSPEGGRSTSGGLSPFKTGPFIFAINAQIPIIPVVIRGAAEVMSKNSLLPNWKKWKLKVEVEFLDAIPSQGLSLEDRHELQKKTFEAMLKKI